MDIKDKVVIITGASKGIGSSIAKMLAQKGARLAISARDENLLNKVANLCPTEVLVFPGDMSHENEIKNFINATCNRFGHVDILINNAGLGIFKPIAETKTEDWDTMFNLNMRGLFIATREALPFLRKAGESIIVNVASLAGKNAIANAAGYVATKHAVVGFSRSLMLEERKNGVRVATISSGSVVTPFFDRDTELYSPDNRG